MSEKKLKHFYNKNLATAKRWKSLLAWSDTADEATQKKMYVENFYLIFAVLQDVLTAYEASLKKGKADAKDVTNIVRVFRSSLIFLQELVKKGWQTHKITNMITMFLYKENKQSLREQGLELLLHFLNALQLDLSADDADTKKDQVHLLGQVMNLYPMVEPGAHVMFPFEPLEAPAGASILLEGGSDSRENALDLLRAIFDYVEHTAINFEYWLELLKINVFPTFFPAVCRQMGLLPKDDETGFTVCPPDVLQIIIGAVETWMGKQEHAAVLWSRAQNAQLMLEIFTQATVMPTNSQYTSASLSCLSLFHGVFMTTTPMEEVQNRLPQYRKYFLSKLSSVFLKPTTPGTLSSHADLCKETLNLLKSASSLWEHFNKDNQDTLLILLLNVAQKLFTKSDPSPNPELGREMAWDLVDATIFIWLRSKSDSWKALQNVVSFLFTQSSDAIAAASRNLQQMTLLLRDFYYPQPEKKESKRKLGAHGAQTKDQVSRHPDYVVPPDMPEPDASIFEMGWDADSVLKQWNNTLQIFAKINQIREKDQHQRSMEAILTVLEYLLHAEAGVPYAVLSDASVPHKPLVLIEVFGPWLLEGVTGVPQSHERGRAAAMQGLCRIVFRHADPLPLPLLSHVYGVVAQVLEQEPTSVVAHRVLEYGSNAFNLALPGVNALVPYFLHAAKCTLTGHAPPKVCRNAIAAVASMVCLPNHYRGLHIPMVMEQPFNKLPQAPSTADRLSYAELKAQVATFLREARLAGKDPEHRSMALYAIGVSVMEELLNGEGDVPYVTDGLNDLLVACMDDDMDVGRAALASVAAVSSVYDTLAQLDQGLVNLVVEALCTNVEDHLIARQHNVKLQVQEVLVELHFSTLVEWILAGPATLMEEGSVLEKVWGAIEMGLLGERLADAVSKRGRSKKGGDSPDASSGSSADLGCGLNTVADLFQARKEAPVHGSECVAEAASVTLLHLVALLNHFPGPAGPEVHASMVTEVSDTDLEEPSENCVYFSCNGRLLSVQPIELPDGSRMARIIVRDVMGRFAWDMRCQFDDFLPKPDVPLLQPDIPPPAQDPNPILASLQPFTRKSGQVPVWDPNQDVSQVDKLDHLLSYLAETYDDCPYLKAEPLQDDTHEQLVVTAQEAMELQEDATRDASPRQAHLAVFLPEASEATHARHLCRMFLSHMNWLSYEQRAHFKLLERGAQVQRSINTLDTKHGRETFKIGVLYVQHGQDDQLQILANDTRSPAYDQLVKGLGWEVDVARHRGYIGGLDTTKFSTGHVAPYYCDAVMELMWHDLTLMPTNTAEGKEQQVHKKRHVGNDVANVCFTEHCRDYDPETISTQFNNAIIIIYPTACGMYRIQVGRKREQVHPLFGPLLHGMLVPANLLAPLVRITALNANRHFLLHKAGYLKPFVARTRAIQEIMQRYEEPNDDYHDMVMAVFNAPPPPSSS